MNVCAPIRALDFHIAIFFFFPAFTSHMKTRLDILISFRLYLKNIYLAFVSLQTYYKF